MQTVSVSPAANGWAVRSEAIENDLLFRHGSKAEEAAKRIALAMAEAGHTTELSILLRDGSTATRLVLPAKGRASSP